VAAPSIKTPPQDVAVDEGDDAEFTATAEGTAPLTFAWRRDDGDWEEQEPGDATESTFRIPSATRTDSGARVRVKVKDKDGNWSDESAPAMLAVRSEEEIVLWVKDFARNAAIAVGCAAGLVLLFVFLAVADVLRGPTDEAGLAAVIALLLVAVGVFVVAAGIFLALLEFRGRARTLEELRAELRSSGAREIRAAAIPDLIKVLPEALKSFGQLRATAALLATAAVLFICGTVVASELADDDPATTTTSGTDTGAAEEPTESVP
jgi:hypothetical protein